MIEVLFFNINSLIILFPVNKDFKKDIENYFFLIKTNSDMELKNLFQKRQILFVVIDDFHLPNTFLDILEFSIELLKPFKMSLC